jgi:L,D-peptidoglycan transpeptidase YkuD (ErfK/YbiS/YcfS/YnhG family)
MRRCGLLLVCVLTLICFFPGETSALPPEVRQLVVSVAPNWDASKGKLQLFERDGNGWRAVSPVMPALYGRAGLAWGRGVLGTNEEGRKKVERDKRAPAGVFRIGMIYGYDAQLPPGSDYPYHQVTEADAWIDDPGLPHYNQHVTVDPDSPPAWFQRQKMRHGDFAYHWLVEIRHNSDPPVPNAGSAIFFHIRRGVNRPTAGCTTIERGNLESMIRWLRAGENPHYALLPWSEYQQKWRAWGLPSPDTASSLAP